jgi:3-hydroxyisobutyrate dehydrogenase-like beta-hydroxyacid dehydrogenase
VGKPVVGLIGLGAMGLPMAANLLRKGFEVVGFDVDAGRLAGAAVRRTESVAEVVESAGDVIISVVRTLPQTEAVVEQVTRRGVLLVVMSTITPVAMAAIGERLRERGIDVLDAPVSGGTAGAEAGTLTTMLSGSPEARRRARPVLQAMCTRIFEVGDRPGRAQAVKLANQLMLAVAMLGTYEGLKLARSHGVESADVIPIINASTGDSWVAENWEMVRSWWEGLPEGSSLDIIYKDLRSLLGDAADQKLSLPVTAAAFNALREAWR